MNNITALITFLVLLTGPFQTSARGSKDRQLQNSLVTHRQLQQEVERQGTSDPLKRVLNSYLSNKELNAHLKDFTKRCGSISKLYTIGKSVKGAPLLALEISDRPGVDEGTEPSVKLVGNLHGDEPTGRVFTLAFAEWLCKNRLKNSIAKKIVETTRVWLVPTLNPDGFAARTRGNARNRDLNRDFPDRFANPSMTPTGNEQPETVAMMNWSKTKRFVASLAFHEGALVANYPWDGSKDKSSTYQKSPDDATFKYLASKYAKNHRQMISAKNSEFPTGITNGADWYPIYGSMQDWNYIVARCMELTIEASYSKWPPESQLAELWADNLPAITSFVLAAGFGGVRGQVLAESAALRPNKGKKLKPIVADISIEGSPFKVRSGTKGDYFRALAPGNYTLLVRKTGYPDAKVKIVVPKTGKGIVRDFVLRRGPKNAANSSNNNNARKVLATSAPSYQKDGLILVGVGCVVSYGLWFSHQQLVRGKRSTTNRAM